jgi:hypothetical protein
MNLTYRTILTVAVALFLSTSAGCAVTSTYAPVSPNTSFMSADSDQEPAHTPRPAAREDHRVWVAWDAIATHGEATAGDHDY